MEMASWMTPSSLFVLLNLIIGTILVSAKFGSRKTSRQHDIHDRDSPHRLVRATSSMIDRVRSLNLSLYNFDQPSSSEGNPTRELTRSPSLLERLKYVYKPDPEPENHPDSAKTEVDHSTRELTRSPSLLQRLKYVYKPDPEPENSYTDNAKSEVGHPTRELSRSPSFLERLKSVYRPDPEPESHLDHDHEVRRSKSEHAKSEVVRAKGKRMMKSMSEKGVEIKGGRVEDEDVTEVEKRRPATTTRAVAAAEGMGVDAQADDFINKFRNHLKLQRLESFNRFTDMIKGK